MSKCISQRGEFSEHETDADYVCQWCGVLDEERFIAELNRLRVLVVRQDTELRRFREGVAEMIQRAESAAAWVGKSGAWGDRTTQIVGIYSRAAIRLRLILGKPDA